MEDAGIHEFNLIQVAEHGRAQHSSLLLRNLPYLPCRLHSSFRCTLRPYPPFCCPSRQYTSILPKEAEEISLEEARRHPGWRHGAVLECIMSEARWACCGARCACCAWHRKPGSTAAAGRERAACLCAQVHGARGDRVTAGPRRCLLGCWLQPTTAAVFVKLLSPPVQAWGACLCTRRRTRATCLAALPRVGRAAVRGRRRACKCTCAAALLPVQHLLSCFPLHRRVQGPRRPAAGREGAEAGAGGWAGCTFAVGLPLRLPWPWSPQLQHTRPRPTLPPPCCAGCPCRAV